MQLKKLELELSKLKSQMNEKDDNKTISLKTSRYHFIDPRISVSW